MTDMSTGDDASCYTNLSTPLSLQMYSNVAAARTDAVSEATSQLLYGLAELKERVHHLRTLLSPDSSSAIDAMHVAVQDLISTASSVLLLPSMTGQSLAVPSRGQLGQGLIYPCSTSVNDDHQIQTMLDWPYDQTYSNLTTNSHYKMMNTVSPAKSISGKYDIVELDASDLLAKYTHYCHVCGKGFKRDANLRMHMRAHGDEYKTSAALSNPAKKTDKLGDNSTGRFGLDGRPKKYSCPQDGCKWNQRHAKFQPLKSMICVKNHYKRSHCPKMYVCKRCGRKQFSVLSDLRTHEKHCGDLKWQCSCGTTFSRKDKLMGHVALFVGHSPAVLTSSSSSSNARIAKEETQFLSPSLYHMIQ